MKTPTDSLGWLPMGVPFLLVYLADEGSFPEWFRGVLTDTSPCPLPG